MRILPVDDESLKYMKLTGRSDETSREQRIFETKPYMFFDVEKEDPNYTDVIELDLSTVEHRFDKNNHVSTI